MKTNASSRWLIWLMSLSALMAGILSVGCDDRTEVSTQSVKETQTGLASFYGRGFQGEKTASGEIFDKNEMVAAHPSHPLGTKARVTNLENGRSVEVRIIDRGPAREHQANGVIIDLSEGAAAKLDIVKDGKARVKVEALEWGDDSRK